MDKPQHLFHQKKVFQRILDRAVQLADARGGAILLLNPSTGGVDVEFTQGRNVRLRLEEAEIIARRGKSFCASGDDCWIAVSPKIQSELAVPIEINSQSVGLIYVFHQKAKAFSSQHETSLKSWAKDSAGWLEVVWELNQLRTKAEQLESLVEMGQSIASQEVLSDVLHRAAGEARRLMKAKMASVMLLSEDGESLALAASAGASSAYAKKPDLPVSESLAGIVIRRKKPLASLDVRKDSRYQHTTLAKRDKLVSLLCVPLVFEKQVLGVLSIYTETLHRFSNEEIRLLTAMAGLSSVVIARVRMAERMSRMEENLKSSERLSALGWLAAEVAHEIRNPLAVLQMLFHALENDLPAHAHKDARLIQTKMTQMNRIVEQVLSFARSSEPTLERIYIEQMMDDLLLLTRHKLAEQNIDIKRVVQTGLPPLHGDRMQLEQALLNLILNACHAMPAGGTLTLSVKKRKHELVLGVKDTGVGISKRDKERLFQPLMTTKQGGSGIGLVLVRKTVEHHGGRLICRSQKGRGTSFEICLPV